MQFYLFIVFRNWWTPWWRKYICRFLKLCQCWYVNLRIFMFAQENAFFSFAFSWCFKLLNHYELGYNIMSLGLESIGDLWRFNNHKNVVAWTALIGTNITLSLQLSKRYWTVKTMAYILLFSDKNKFMIQFDATVFDFNAFSNHLHNMKKN